MNSTAPGRTPQAKPSMETIIQRISLPTLPTPTQESYLNALMHIEPAALRAAGSSFCLSFCLSFCYLFSFLFVFLFASIFIFAFFVCFYVCLLCSCFFVLFCYYFFLLSEFCFFCHSFYVLCEYSPYITVC